jgi:hypothetical protein
VLAAPGKGEVFAAPEILPDGKTLLYTVAKGEVGLERWDTAQIVVQAIGLPQRTVVIDHGSEAHYVETGHLVYAVGSSLLAVPFDREHFRGHCQVEGRAPYVATRRRRHLVT